MNRIVFSLMTLSGTVVGLAAADAGSAPSPAATPAVHDVKGWGDFVRNVYAYQPNYAAIDAFAPERSVEAKFQLSLAVRAMAWDRKEPCDLLRPDGLYLAYSQTSLWDLEGDSRPFIDNSYRPEIWWHATLSPDLCGAQWATEFGYAHESNGKANPDSRSIDSLALRSLTAWRARDWIFTLQPRVRYYIDKSDNPDIARYRGNVDLDVVANQEGGLGVRLVGRIGSEWDRGSIQAELTYPARRVWDRLDGFLYLQVFHGYSETLIQYDEKPTDPRILIGISISR